MTEEAEKTRKHVQQPEVIGSDETGARVEGENWWERMIETDRYSYHKIVD